MGCCRRFHRSASATIFISITIIFIALITTTAGLVPMSFLATSAASTTSTTEPSQSVDDDFEVGLTNNEPSSNSNSGTTENLLVKLCFSNSSDKSSDGTTHPNYIFPLLNFYGRPNNGDLGNSDNTFNTTFFDLDCKNDDDRVEYEIKRGRLEENLRVHLNENGSVVIPHPNTTRHVIVISSDDYCVSDYTDQVLTVVVCSGREPASTNIQEEENELYNLVLFALYCFVCVFLFLIVFFYGLTWRKQQTHGWAILAFSTSNFCSYFFWTVSLGVWQFEPVGPNGLRKVMIGTPFCVTNIALVHFSDIAAFTWMTILNFDICYTIRSMTLRWNRSEGKLRFLIYSCFGFGTPVIILIISLVREYEFGHFKGREFRKQYGYDPCGLDKYYATSQVWSLYGIAVILKGIFIFLLVKTLIDYHRGAIKLQNERQQKLRRQAVLYGKLFVLMDFTWVFEIIWGVNFGESNTNTWYRTVQDAIYLLQSLFLFWVFVCKQEMKDLLIKNYECFQSFFEFFGVKQDMGRPLGNSSDMSAGVYGGAGAARTRDKKGFSATNSATSQSSALS